VLLITARDEEHLPASVEGEGARGPFRKPFDGKELLATLDVILQPRS